ncbi:hypothetical protein HELRODRAFT_194032 [Helobdella robusta]|uniref:Pre-mRNA-splicing factor SLU7 n=1 Tax=Helobdella robusta TaxID=6412 RepID=T1FVL3_HELRO|nr:hypothetical protein HELRODRAFT_194032 [Helobdella robusta]ESN93491.1 hypothetical protein HELRODRAFT_194032 [Helobdella robusta]
MSFQINVPPSLVAKIKKDEETAEEESREKKREDWRKIKELEEARKAGTAPAMQDEEGKDINPHIPQYIMQAPWYIGALQPTLKHQREPDERKKVYSGLNEWYNKGVKEEVTATKFREGACSNCGAMTHKKKDCFERPRKIGAEYTGTNIAPDEFSQPQLDFNYESKRDRWNGYDPANHRRIFEEFQKMEEMRREMKAKKLDKSLMVGEEDGAVEDNAKEEEEDGDEDDDEKYADSMAMPGQKFETKQRITVRNLRIREDTAKYLYNLDPNSAFYDPKTRSMRENPFKDKGVDPKDLPYAGDNFVRWSGDAYEIAKKQKFAWEAYEKGSDVHVQGLPTKLELLNKEYEKKKDIIKDRQWSNIIEKYGGQEHLNVLPKSLLLAQTEEYVEYSRHGTIVKGSEKAIVRSRYEEDVLEKNHTAIWGSFWKEGSWGYKCCESIVRGSYCIGQSGLQTKLLEEKEEEEEEKENEDNKSPKDKIISEKGKTSSSASNEEDTTNAISSNGCSNTTKSLLHQHLEKLQAEEKQKEREERKRKKKSKKNKKHKKHKKQKKEGKSNNKSRDSSSDDDDDSSDDDDDDDREKKITKAIRQEKKRLKEVEKMMKVDEKSRPYNVLYDGKGPTEEQIEAYQRLRVRPDDPMANYVDNER